MISGSLLIYPKGYTFHTHWIQAAYLLLSIFVLSIFLLKYLKYFKYLKIIYFILILLLIFIIRDAVTKTTFF